MNLPRSTMTRMTALVLAAVTLSACAPTPTPSPTPTAAFASEEEAFAAAEDTYRAYNDASNGDGDTADFLTGAALESDIETARYLKQNNLSLEGHSEIISFAGTRTSLEQIAKIEAEVCLDVSASRVVDSEGTDVTPSDRKDRWLIDVSISGTAESLWITNSVVSEDKSC